MGSLQQGQSAWKPPDSGNFFSSPAVAFLLAVPSFSAYFESPEGVKDFPQVPSRSLATP